MIRSLRRRFLAFVVSLAGRVQRAAQRGIDRDLVTTAEAKAKGAPF